jgi:hypothetical protein
MSAAAGRAQRVFTQRQAASAAPGGQAADQEESKRGPHVEAHRWRASETVVQRGRIPHQQRKRSDTPHREHHYPRARPARDCRARAAGGTSEVYIVYIYVEVQKSSAGFRHHNAIL